MKINKYRGRWDKIRPQEESNDQGKINEYKWSKNDHNYIGKIKNIL